MKGKVVQGEVLILFQLNNQHEQNATLRLIIFKWISMKIFKIGDLRLPRITCDCQGGVLHTGSQWRQGKAPSMKMVDYDYDYEMVDYDYQKKAMSNSCENCCMNFLQLCELHWVCWFTSFKLFVCNICLWVACICMFCLVVSMLHLLVCFLHFLFVEFVCLFVCFGLTSLLVSDSVFVKVKPNNYKCCLPLQSRLIIVTFR